MNLQERRVSQKSRRSSNDWLWKLREFSEYLWRKTKFAYNSMQLAEDAFIRKHFEGIPERLGISLVETEDGLYFVTEGMAFAPFWIDSLPWDFDDIRENYTFVKNLIQEESPLKTIDILYRPTEIEQTGLVRYVDEVVESAKTRGVHTSLWEDDLRALVEEINKTRIRHLRYGVFPPPQLEAVYVRNALNKVRLSSQEARSLVFGVLNGFWNQNIKTNAEENLIQLSPHHLRRNEAPIGVVVSARGDSKAYMSAVEIYGLGLNVTGRSEETTSYLNTDRWLRSFLPYQLKEAGDTIILVSTFYVPEEPAIGGRRQLLDLPLRQTHEISVRLARDERQREEKNGNSAYHLERVGKTEKNYVDAFHRAQMMLESDKEDKVTYASFNLLVQSPNPDRCQELAERLQDRLVDARVLSQLASKRDGLLNSLTTSLPVIHKRSVEEKIAPFPLRTITGSIVPDSKEVPSKTDMKVLVGKRLPLGEPYYLVFGVSVAILAGQGSGKSALLILLSARLDGLLDKESVIWVYNGKNVQEGVVKANWDISYPALANHLNRDLDSGMLPQHLRDGVVFASSYKSAEDLKKDLLFLRDRGARIIVFNANEEQHQKYNLEFGFFDAFFEHMKGRIPGAIFVDEIARLGSDERAKRLFQNSIEISEASQWFIWTGQTSKYLPDAEPFRVRTQAQANTKITCVGTTSLIASLAEEANIDKNLFEERAYELEDTVADYTIRDEPGVFVASKAGGKLMQSFQVLTIDEKTTQFIHRKQKEVRERFGR